MPYASRRGEIREPRVGDVVYRGVLEHNRIVRAVHDDGAITVYAPLCTHNRAVSRVPASEFFYYGHSPQAALAAEAALAEVCL